VPASSDPRDPSAADPSAAGPVGDDPWPANPAIDPGAGPRRGEVVVFDDPRGIGVVRSTLGELVPFHCTAVADGSRTVPVGAAVSFVVVPGRLGRWEAIAMAPAPPD
jgi:cold shock CspA family protein